MLNRINPFKKTANYATSNSEHKKAKGAGAPVPDFVRDKSVESKSDKVRIALGLQQPKLKPNPHTVWWRRPFPQNNK